MEVEINMENLAPTVGYLEGVVNGLGGPEYLSAMRAVLLRVTASARRNAPADEGRLRNSIVPAMTMKSGGLGAPTLEGSVGSKVFYAPFMELGTRHTRMPPPSVLQGWANRKSQGAAGRGAGFLIARAILARGGLDARKYLERALTDNEEFIVAALGRAVTRVVNRG